MAQHLDLDYGVTARLQDAVAWWAQRVPVGSRVRVVGDDDSDGASGAWAAATALNRGGWKATAILRPIHDLPHVKAILRGRWDALVVVDAGSAFVTELEADGRPVLILDHHATQPRTTHNVFEVNPRSVGGDRTWHVSASCVAALFAIALDPTNRDVAYAGLAGAISDRQHLGGFDGLAGVCLEAGVKAGNLHRRRGLTLPGATVGEAIAESFDPYFPGLALDPAAVDAFLTQLGVESSADPGSLPEAASRRVAQALEQRLAQSTTVPERLYPFFDEQLPLDHESGVPTVLSLARCLEAATAENRHNVALSLLNGSVRSYDTAQGLARNRARRVLQELERIRPLVTDAPHLRWVLTKDGANTGVYAHALLTFVLGDAKPLAVINAHGRHAKLSVRGSPRLFLAGLDLASAVGEAARSVGGHGGGHPGAAGASVPRHHVPEFLEALGRGLARRRTGAA